MLINTIEFMKLHDLQYLPNYITENLTKWENINNYFKNNN